MPVFSLLKKEVFFKVFEFERASAVYLLRNEQCVPVFGFESEESTRERVREIVFVSLECERVREIEIEIESNRIESKENVDKV